MWFASQAVHYLPNDRLGESVVRLLGHGDVCSGRPADRSTRSDEAESDDTHPRGGLPRDKTDEAGNGDDGHNYVPPVRPDREPVDFEPDVTARRPELLYLRVEFQAVDTADSRVILRDYRCDDRLCRRVARGRIGPGDGTQRRRYALRGRAYRSVGAVSPRILQSIFSTLAHYFCFP